MKYEIEIKPFTVPNFVIPKMPAVSKGDSFDFEKVPSIPLKELHPEALADLCSEFRKSCFEKAGCKDPGDDRTAGTPKLFRKQH